MLLIMLTKPFILHRKTKWLISGEKVGVNRSQAFSHTGAGTRATVHLWISRTVCGQEYSRPGVRWPMSPPHTRKCVHFLCGSFERGNTQEAVKAITEKKKTLEFYSHSRKLFFFVVGFVGRGARRLTRILPRSWWEATWTTCRGRGGRGTDPGAAEEAVACEIIDVIEAESEREWKLSRRTERFLVCVT